MNRADRGIVEGTSGSVAGEHSKACRERLDVGLVVATAKVVDSHAGVGDFFERAIGVLVVQEWSPVGGQVLLDLAGCAIG